MEKAQRNVLYNAIVRCRQLLEEDLTRQLEGTYGIRPDGTIEPLADMGHLDAVGRADRQAMEAAVKHNEASGATRAEALNTFLRASAFTFLNRLAALKLMEHTSRGLIQPSIGGGMESNGFRHFCRLSPAAVRGQADGGYRLYLETLFDDLAQVLGALFDRSLPTSILFPSPPCLQTVLAELNQPALDPAWAEDEAIGWVYQYFTPAELRDSARKASSAPRNSHELAFRNQFYTPRYVVAFLADNSLGRLWCQWRSGETELAEKCQYLDVRDESEKRKDVRSEDVRSEDVTRKDPREVRVLDPACGSGHFLLYCFDLLLVIYREAYDDPDMGAALRTHYPERDSFLQAVPGLILEHNLFGIDIDIRACQIASLALWLRAQRAFNDLGLKTRQRPHIDHTNIVCAEPMPGEHDLLGEFVRDLQPAVLGNMLRDVWQKMALAGEAGSLLRVEQEMRDSVRRAREALAALPEGIQLTLFGPQQPQQLPLRLDPAELHDEAFWDQAEARLRQALEDYARRAGAGSGVSRRLFAEDALQGIAFIDLLQQPFDVVLMNPPFGAASLGAKAYIQQAYPRTKNDLYAAFVERGLELLRPCGYLGAITSRTGFFLTSFRKWREEVLLGEGTLIALADLGYGVLDTAMVETAAYVVRKE
jgi:hypothetical protein